MNVVDSSGWIEYFFDSPRADLFATAIEDVTKLLVPVVSIYEVHKVLSCKLPAGAVLSCLDVMRQGRVLDLTDKRAVAAADIASKHKLAMADAVIYSMAREFDGTLWTQDVDYNGLAAVRYFEKPQG
ncbi:MAG: type II toxin-antitoxin system VapC family toxin [Burkholderiaceae bacterium]